MDGTKVKIIGISEQHKKINIFQEYVLFHLKLLS